ncbi:MAG: peptidylprolyl isomerase [Pirellulales bacterium]|nr:peptidylprolyl isomerase [Pirellulales bacterium]
MSPTDNPMDGNEYMPRAARPGRRIAMIVGSLLLIGGIVAVRYFQGNESATAAPNPAASGPVQAGDASDKVAHNVVALVNGERISREDLARECLRHYGKEVLESVANRLLIAQECSRRGITITRQEIDDEIASMAKRFSLPVSQWYQLLEEERGIKPDQYANDIIWSLLALRKLAGPRLTVTREELQKAYESEFGPAVRARLIAASSAEKAEKLRAMAVANPDKFGDLAKKYSVDTPSASDNGWIPPIRKHVGHKEIEDTVFSMADGEISPVIRVESLFLILKREVLIPARKIPLNHVAARLQTLIERDKLQAVSQEVFAELQKKAKMENYFNDPAKRDTGIAAVLNGKRITVRQLAEECINRHGEEVLEGAINRKLLEQACKKQGVVVTNDDLLKEIAQAAETMVPAKKDGTPDVEAWIKLVTEQQGISEEVYLRDAVWPSVALRKLAQVEVKIADEDIEKAYEANYGPRARCLAIVLKDLRRAQQVWAEARQNPTPEHFGDLAEQYSIEMTSKKLRGQVPPIKRFGGKESLEKEAFSLKPGELSGVIQAGEHFVILLCQGFTERVDIDKASVRPLIEKDLREKKLRIAMDKYYQRLQDHAAIDNFLTGKSQSPPQVKQASALMPLSKVQR